MEEAVLAQLEQHPELLKPFFQYNSPNDHRLIWAFYHLIAEQQTEMLSQPETLRHLIALTLNRGSELPPEVYFERYQQLLALCTPSFRPTRRRFRPNSTLPPRRCGRRWPGNPQTSCSSSGCSILRSTRWSSAPAPLFQRHRPVSRHDLPPHELARVRRVYPRGQAEPARLQP